MSNSQTQSIKSKRSVYKLQKVKELKTLTEGHLDGVLQLVKIDETKMLSVGLDQ